MIITSKNNDLVKHIKSLKEKKYRDEYNEFVIEGIKIVEEAILETAKVKQIIIDNNAKDNGLIPKELIENTKNYECIYVSKEVFETIADVKNPQGICAVVDKYTKDKKLDIDLNQKLYLILDNIQDPGNMGTILRTADSIGLTQIFVQKGNVDFYNPKVIRSTMGAIFRVKVIEIDNICDIITVLKQNGINVFATDLNTDKSIYTVVFKNSAIIIGNEANGVSKEALELATERVKIPMIGKTESLNAGVATGIILYEAIRQINFNK